MKYRRSTRALVVAGVALVAAAPMAAAHVTVNPGEAPKGGFAALAFRVPNERDDASTTEVQVHLPEDHPISSVRVKPKAGWTYTLEHRTLDEPIDNHGTEVTEVVSSITWSGGEIGATEYDEFEVSLGRLPEDVDQITFPAIQTYDSGEVVRWIDEPAADGEEEPERPAPVLRLVDPEGGETTDAAGGGEGEAAGGVTVENAASQDDVDAANTRAVAAMAIGAVGLAVALIATFRSRRAG